MSDYDKKLIRNSDDLQNAGKVTVDIIKAHAESEFEKSRIVQNRLFESDFDRVIKLIESSGQLDINKLDINKE